MNRSEQYHYPNKLVESFSSRDLVTHLNGKRLMILGGSYLQVPAIIEARRLGIITAVLDYDATCPGHELADSFYLQSTTDKEAVLYSARHFQADGIITLGTDWPMRSVAYAAQELGLPAISYRAARQSTDKYEMIEQLAAHQVAHPKYFVFDVLNHSADLIRHQMSLPCIIKPVDASGSRGVVIVKNWADLEEALAYSASQAKHGQLIVQEYMVGPEVSVEVLIIDSYPHVLSITDKTTTGSPHFVETKHTQPSRLPPEQQAEIIRLAQDSCRALNLTTGAAHVEIIYTKEGPKIVEVGPRMGGDLIATHLVPLSTGINYTQLIIRQALGETISLPETRQRGACIRYIERPAGNYLGVDNLDKILEHPGIIQAGIFIAPGSSLRPLKSSTDRLGYIISNGQTADLADQLALQADEQLIIRME